MRTAIYGPSLRPAERIARLDAPAGLANAPFGARVRAMAEALVTRGGVGVYVASDDRQAASVIDLVRFLTPALPTLLLPAWDCPPYDRVSPSAAVASQRCRAFSRLAHREAAAREPLLMVTTGAALVQRVPPREMFARASFHARVGEVHGPQLLLDYLAENGFARTTTVREAGEFAVRGGLIDLYVSGDIGPVRLDWFGEQLESIRSFDPETQRSTAQLREIDLAPASEVLFTDQSLGQFRAAYLETFGVPNGDPLYEAARARIRRQGLEHWLPLFHTRLTGLEDYVPEGALWLLDPLSESAMRARFAQAEDHHDARLEAAGGDVRRAKVLAPGALYLSPEAVAATLSTRLTLSVEAGETTKRLTTVDLGAKDGRDFTVERLDPTVNLFEAAVVVARADREAGRTVVFAGWSEGSTSRLANLLEDHGLDRPPVVASLAEARAAGLVVTTLSVEHGWAEADLTVTSEQDLLGEKMMRARRARRVTHGLAEAVSLTPGDLVVHSDHGVARFIGLKTIEANGAPHDCLELHYAEGAKLFLPVENIELVTRYGGDTEESVLDRLGGAAWQGRKARAKRRILELAAGLIALAAERQVKVGQVFASPGGIYEEFAARFPYEETDDQLRAIEDVVGDLSAGRPMDRLICGDVGFGKTEVALRAAFVAAMSGAQVAVIAPTTLLAQQHARTFSERLSGWPLVVRGLSRFTPSAEATATRAGLTEGTVDVAVGTHALLAPGISFKRLGLLIIDEEQRFGVKHKERLKELKADVHVLTMSATPIPRTLQMALTGIRDLSIIATPPVDRLSVRTYIVEEDEVTLREALLRERFRGGQSFIVAPRVADLPKLEKFLREKVPEVSFVTAHGQMPTGTLDDVMSEFYAGKYDVLLATTIIEAGLDIPRANTLIVHRADMFGLAQLYQIRGRVGRAKVRAYAYLTVPTDMQITEAAEKRLKVLNSLDSLGAGFQLASHDLDLRGGGNLLGDEQSGHVREVGVELYQSMLRDAVEALKDGDKQVEDDWSPQINIGAAVLIPESYIADLSLRLSFYRRLGDVETDEAREAVAAEMADRFGPLPQEVRQLLDVAALRAICKRLGIAKVDAGVKGGVVSFRERAGIDPVRLVQWVSRKAGIARLRPDQKLAITQDWVQPQARTRGVMQLMQELSQLAA
jgi:transcription-repair coupling factor (superfamily II helicase)